MFPRPSLNPRRDLPRQFHPGIELLEERVVMNAMPAVPLGRYERADGGGVAAQSPVAAAALIAAGSESDAAPVAVPLVLAGQNASQPADVNGDGQLSPIDPVSVIWALRDGGARAISAPLTNKGDLLYVDVSGDGFLSPRDVVLSLNPLIKATPMPAEATITAAEVEQLLKRGSAASASSDAIIAIVDRGGTILGVRVESGVTIKNPDDLVFKIDGAVAKARTAAFFSNNRAPLTSRTIRYISQSTITQREVESDPSDTNLDSTKRGPGFVAPIGLGGQFPPGIQNTPLVDLFGIEHTNRDTMYSVGDDRIRGTVDDVMLSGRFNIDPNYVVPGQQISPPVSYGAQSGLAPRAQPRGIATLPGGIPLYRNGALVGGIGVFFPGPDGYATYEQGFVAGKGQSELDRTNAPRVLESEWIAFAAAGGSSGAGASVGTLAGVPAVQGFDLPSGRIDLAGITLESVGPIAGKMGVQKILSVGSSVGTGDANNKGKKDEVIDPAGHFYADGTAPPTGWLVLPHAGSELTRSQVAQIINQGVADAMQVRAQIRLPLGTRTSMVLAVADTNGELLGLFRMPDATYFSIDVAVAKARNTAYYANPDLVQEVDLVDDERDGEPDLPDNVAFTNRTFRFVASPRYPLGIDGTVPGAFSILRDPGIDPSTAENLGPALPARVYSNETTSVYGFDSFNPARNFREPVNLENQNGIVFFPGSTALYLPNKKLVGGFGVSGDGVDQDDVVTFSGSVGYQAPDELRADHFEVREIPLPYQKFSRNPRA